MTNPSKRSASGAMLRAMGWGGGWGRVSSHPPPTARPHLRPISATLCRSQLDSFCLQSELRSSGDHIMWFMVCGVNYGNTDLPFTSHQTDNCPLSCCCDRRSRRRAWSRDCLDAGSQMFGRGAKCVNAAPTIKRRNLTTSFFIYLPPPHPWNVMTIPS